MNPYYLAFAKKKRLIAFTGNKRLHPLLISKADASISEDLVIERKQDVANVDDLINSFDRIDSFLDEAEIDEPNIYISLDEDTIDEIKAHIQATRYILDSFVEGQASESPEALDAARDSLFASCWAFFLIDLKKQQLRLTLESITALRLNDNRSKLVSKGRLYGHYTNDPLQITQTDGVYVVDELDVSEHPSVFFELDFADLETMLESNLSIIGVLQSKENANYAGTDSIRVNDYVCFYSDETDKNSLPFYCLLLPSYLK